MLSKKEVDQVLEANERGRPYRGVFYALLAAGGIILMVDPTRQLGEAGSVRWVWSGFMIAGTLLSLWGVVKDHWRAELYGLPLQTSSLLGLIYVLVVGGDSTARLAFACFVAAPIAVIVHRMVVLQNLSRATRKMMKKHLGGQ